MIALPFLTACKKENTNSANCEVLKNALVINNETDIETQVNRIIQSLPDKSYSAQNLEKLVQKMKACGIDSEQLCFDCIQTLPSQSEIRIQLQVNGTTVERLMDISYTPSNTMVFHNIH